MIYIICTLIIALSAYTSLTFIVCGKGNKNPNKIDTPASVFIVALSLMGLAVASGFLKATNATNQVVLWPFAVYAILTMIFYLILRKYTNERKNKN